MDHLKLTVDKLSVEEISGLVLDDSCGAVSLFVGTTRSNFEGKKVLRLEYEAYEPMALKAMKSICDEVRNKWPTVHGIALFHRLGMVPSREASVVIAVSSPHRRESLDAVALMIESLKSSVPIWKKEVYDDEQAVWKENTECTHQPSSQTLTNKAQSDIEQDIDKNLIQINVSSEELQQRIQNFIERKREQVNINNIHDFIPNKGEGETEDTETCARVRTQFVKRTDSKGLLKIMMTTSCCKLWKNEASGSVFGPLGYIMHVNSMSDVVENYRVYTYADDTCLVYSVRKVNNEWGPQTVQHHEPIGDCTSASGLPPSIAERVLAVEKYLNIKSVSPDVFKRLKEMEDKVAYLQAVSPEYSQFWKSNSGNPEVKEDDSVEYTFSADDIAQKIELLEKQGCS